MNFQVVNLKHPERAKAAPMPAPVPLMDRLLSAPAAFTRESHRSNEVTRGPSRLRHMWPIAAIAVGGLATVAWDGYLLWQMLRISLNLAGFDI